MFRNTVSYGGTLFVVVVLVFMIAGSGNAAPRGGGHGGGHSGGAGHGGFHGGGHSGGFHGGFHDGHNFHSGHVSHYFYPYYGGYNYGYYPQYFNSYPSYNYGYSSGSGYLPDITTDGDTTDTPPQTDTAAHLMVSVPADAQLWFEGVATNSSGSMREFDTPPLSPDHRYSYDIRAQWKNEDGHEVSQAQKVGVTAGAHINVKFPILPKTLAQPSAVK